MDSAGARFAGTRGRLLAPIGLGVWAAAIALAPGLPAKALLGRQLRYALVRPFRRDRRLVAPLAHAHQIQRAIGRNAIHPGAKTGPLIELVKLAVGSEETLLHHVFGVLCVSRHTKCQPEQNATMALHERSESVRVTRPCLGYERSVVLHPVVG